MRLDRLVSSVELEGRGEARALIRAGLVTVNGVVCKRPEQKADTAADEVALKGRRLVYRQYVTLMQNKPAGILSATRDERGRTAADLLTGKYARMGLKPAGRLDKDATGLLLMTGDGALIHGIISPSREIWKDYELALEKPLPPDSAERAAAGIALEDGYECLPARLFYEPGSLSAKISLREGKFHQVKRMAAALGSRVTELRRVKIGPIALDPELPEGAFRELTPRELSLLYAACGLVYGGG